MSSGFKRFLKSSGKIIALCLLSFVLSYLIGRIFLDGTDFLWRGVGFVLLVLAIGGILFFNDVFLDDR